MTIIDLRAATRGSVGTRQRGSPSTLRRLGARRSHPVLKLMASGVLALVLLWGGLLPQQLGGRMSYAITDGVSMLPHFHAGDLVILRSEPTYHVGEVAAFHNQQLGVIVLHRIVALHNGRYMFKGDHNHWNPASEPIKSQIVGAEWIHVPGGGRYLGELHVPGVAAVVLALLWLFSFGPRPGSRRRRRRHRHAR